MAAGTRRGVLNSLAQGLIALCLLLCVSVFNQDVTSFQISGVEAASARVGACVAKSCKDGDCEERKCDVLAASAESSKPGSAGTIYSCTGWALNKGLNSALKEWLNSNKHKEYQDLDIQWKQGHNPELHVKNGERIDLNGKDENEINRLLKEKGFKTQNEL